MVLLGEVKEGIAERFNPGGGSTIYRDRVFLWNAERDKFFSEKIFQDLGETATLEVKIGAVAAQRVGF